MPKAISEDQVKEWLFHRDVMLSAAGFPDFGPASRDYLFIRFPATGSQLVAFLRQTVESTYGDRKDFTGGLLFVRETGISDEFFDEAFLENMGLIANYNPHEHRGVLLKADDEYALFVILVFAAEASWSVWFVNDSASLMFLMDDDRFVCVVPRSRERCAELASNLEVWEPEFKQDYFLGGTGY